MLIDTTKCSPLAGRALFLFYTVVGFRLSLIKKEEKIWDYSVLTAYGF